MNYERINSIPLSYDSIPEEPPSNYRKLTATGFILLANLTQYTCFYGIASILFEYLTESTYHWQPFNANMIESVYCTAYLLMALVGGLFADFLFHRILLICLMYICYLFGIMGLVLLKLNTNRIKNFSVPVLCSCENTHRRLFVERTFTNIVNSSMNSTSTESKALTEERCVWFVFVMIFLIGLGSGVSRVILSVIGADQVKSFGCRTVSIYFLVTYAISQLGLIVGNDVMYAFRDSISCLVFLGAMLIFSGLLMVAGMPFYKVNKSKASLRDISSVFKEIHRQYKLRHIDNGNSELSNLINSSKESHGGNVKDRTVDGFCSLMNICAIFWIVIPFSMLQRCIKLMDLQSHRMRIPETINYQTTLYTFESVMIILLTILIIAATIRCLSSHTTFSYTWRILIGSICAIAAVFSASLVEHFRINIFWGYDTNTLIPAKSSFVQDIGNKGSHGYIGHDKYGSADMSVLWMGFPYFLLAAAETLVFPTVMEYSYLSSPTCYQCTSNGLLWAAWGIGSLLDNPFAYSLSGVVYDMMDINKRKGYPCENHSPFNEKTELVCWQSRLDYLYYILLLTVTSLWFLLNFFVRICCPTIYNPLSIGLDETLIDADEEEIEE